MAFYPTWQTDPSQGWQNQFIQQIPQNTSAITSLNSLDFQTQSYAYPSNGYVQTGLGFDPNYGRSPYGAPVQRYDFQNQQLPTSSINQVGLQGVGFSPAAVTYAGQVSAAATASPTPPAVGLQQQHIGVGVGIPSDLNKPMSGNDTPGYPRVSSVPPRSLNCNGYSGDYSGSPQQQQQTANITTSTATTVGCITPVATQQQQQQQQAVVTPAVSPMPPPPQLTNAQTVPQSPTRNLMQQQPTRHVTAPSPNQVPQSPNGNIPTTAYATVTAQNHVASPPQQITQQSQHDWNWNNTHAQVGGGQPTGPNDSYQQHQQDAERHHLNSRIKTMILRKNDHKDGLTIPPEGLHMQITPPTVPGVAPTLSSSLSNTSLLAGPQQTVVQQQQHQHQQQQQPQHAGHFLSYSHHLRGDSHLNSNSNGSNSANVPTTPTPTPTLQQQQQQQQHHQHQQQQQQQQQQQHQQQQQQQHQQQIQHQHHASTGSGGHLTVAGGVGVTTAPEPIGGGGDHIWKPHHSNTFKKSGVSPAYIGAEHNNTTTHHTLVHQQQQQQQQQHHQQHITISHGNTTISHTQQSIIAPPPPQPQPPLTTTQHPTATGAASVPPTETPKKPSRRSKAGRAQLEAQEAEKNSNETGGGGVAGAPHLSGNKILEKPSFAPMHHYPPPPQHAVEYHHGQYIKTEPGLIPPQHNKMEGYERNYQNFIQYADFCQNEVQGQPPHQQDYAAAAAAAANASGYHHSPAAYYAPGSVASSFQQSYQQNFVPGYQHSTGYAHTTAMKTTNGPGLGKPIASASANHMMDIDRKPDTNSIIPLPTNYEKDIPAHAYPIPPHRFAPHLGHGMLEPKVEHMDEGNNNNNNHQQANTNANYAFMSNADVNAPKNGACCRPAGTRIPPSVEHIKDVNSCMGLEPKIEPMSESTEHDMHNMEETMPSNADPAILTSTPAVQSAGALMSNSVAKAKKKTGSKPDDYSDMGVLHEKINPLFDTSDRLEKGNKTEIPECDCFQSDKNPPEPGTYYTHLGKYTVKL